MLAAALRPARVALALLTLWLSAAPCASAEIIDRVLAVVDNEVVTLSDVLAALRFGFVEASGSNPIRPALDRLIERQLMLREVERYGPAEPSPAAIDAVVAALRQRFGGAAQLAAALAQSGLAEDQLRRRIRDDLRIRAYLDQRFAPLTASPDDERRRLAIDEWIAALRRRAEVTILYEGSVSGA